VKRSVTSFVLVALVSTAAEGAPCDGAEVRDPSAPARIGFGPAGFGSLPEACPATEVALQGDAALLVATEDFYGSLAAGAAVRGRFAINEHAWVSAWAPGPSFFYVANATVDASSVDLGPSSLGVHFAIPVSERARLAPFARALLPTETIYQHAVRYGFDQGFTLALGALKELEVLTGMSFPLLLTDGSGTIHTSFGPLVRWEMSYTPVRFFQANAGMSLRARGGDDSGFESFEPLLAVRAFPLEKLRVELDARLPIGGGDRTDLGLALSVAWGFSR
jgi:hypothetical protein